MEISSSTSAEASNRSFLYVRGLPRSFMGSTYSRLPQIRNMYFDVLALLPLVAMRFLVLFKCTRHLSVFHDKVETY